MTGVSKRKALAAGVTAFFGTAAQGSATVPLQDEFSIHPPRTAGPIISLRVDGEKFFVSIDGETFEELRLDASPEADVFRQNVREIMPPGSTLVVPVGPDIIARGGASGGWSLPKPPSTGSKKRIHGSGKVATDPGPEVPEKE